MLPLLRLVGLLVVFLSVPLFFRLVNGTPAQRRVCWFLLGFLPLVTNAWHLDVSLIAWATWPGYVKGALVGVIDALALAIVVSRRDPGVGQPLLWPWLLYIAGTAVATLFAYPALASLFYTWQLARITLLFFAVSKLATDVRNTRLVVAGLAAGIMVQALFSVNERLHGVTQASGTLGHQNLLGMCTHFALLISLAAMLAGDRRLIVKGGVLGGIVAVVLTGSRATVGLSAAGIAALFLLSLLRRTTGTKLKVAAVGVAAVLAATPVALHTLQTRFAQTQTDDSYDERAAFQRAAQAMWHDHPMGVGANQYVVVSNAEGYSARAGVAWNSGSRSANVHNFYLLMAAETGYLGLISFVLLLASALWLGIRTAWRKPRTAAGELALGATVAIAVVAVHCLFEWILAYWVSQALLAIAFGIIAGAAKQQRAEARERKQTARVLRDEAQAADPPLTGRPLTAA